MSRSAPGAPATSNGTPAICIAAAIGTTALDRQKTSRSSVPRRAQTSRLITCAAAASAAAYRICSRDSRSAPQADRCWPLGISVPSSSCTAFSSLRVPGAHPRHRPTSCMLSITSAGWTPWRANIASSNARVMRDQPAAPQTGERLPAARCGDRRRTPSARPGRTPERCAARPGRGRARSSRRCSADPCTAHPCA